MEINEIIEHLGVGKFTYKLILSLTLVYLLDGLELTLTATIAPYLKCQWNLTNFETAVTSCSVFLGLAIGSIFWGWLADQYGRKRPLVAAQFIALYFGMLCIFSNSFIIFSVIRIFVGVGIGSIIFPVCLINEYVPVKSRAISNILCITLYAFGSTYVSIMAYFILGTYSWRVFLFITTIPAIVSFALVLFSPESIRYLLDDTKNDNELKVLEILQRIARDNKRILPPKITIRKYTTKHTAAISSLFTRKYFLTTITSIVILTSSLFNYYGFILWNTYFLQKEKQSMYPTLNHNLTKTAAIGENETFIHKQDYTQQHCHLLSSNDYIQNIILSCSDYISYLIMIFTIEYLGRKKLLVLSFTLTATVNMMIYFPFSKTVLSVIIFIGRIAASNAVCTSHFYVAELFPTSMRGKGVGISNSFARSLTAMVPFLIQYVAHQSLILVIIIFTTLSVLSILFCMTQRETTGKPIDEEFST